MLKKILNKSKWEHRDPEVRRQAIVELPEEEAGRVLPQLATQDPSPEVRRQAVSRLSSLQFLDSLRREDSDDGVRRAALERLQSLLTGEAAGAPSLESRIEFWEGIEDAAVAEFLVLSKAEAPLREQALQAVCKEKVLAEVALKDPEPPMRLQALRQLRDEQVLERVSRDSRKSDKVVHRRAAERLLDLRLARGDEEALRSYCQSLCEGVELLAWDSETADGRSLEDFVQSWEALSLAPPRDLKERFEKACRSGRFAPAPEAPEPPGQLAEPAEPEAIEDPTADPMPGTPEPEADSPADPPEETIQAAADPLEALCRQAEELTGLKKPPSQQSLDRLRRAWERAISQEPSEQGPAGASPTPSAGRFAEALSVLEQQRSQADERERIYFHTIREQLVSAERHLEKDRVQEARLAYRLASDALRKCGRRKSREMDHLRQRLARANAGIRELHDWLHWGNNQQRIRLCEELEALPDQNLPPEELNRRIRRAQKEWKRLEESEKLPIDRARYASGPRLWQRFHAASNRAFEPCKAYFQERAVQRQGVLEEMQRACGEVAELDLEEAEDWRPLDRKARQAGRFLRRLREIEPKERGPMARRLRTLLNTVNARIKALQDGHEAKKRELIAKASQLAAIEDAAQSAREARSLVSAWSEGGPTSRPREQALWKEFRSHCDPVFAREAQEQDRIDGDVKRLCGRLERLCRLKGPQLLAGESEFRETRTAWENSEAAKTNPAWERRFQDLCRKFSRLLQVEGKRHAEEQRRQLLRERRQAVGRKEDLCLRLEELREFPVEELKAVLVQARQDWEALPPLAPSLEKRVKERFLRAEAVLGSEEGENRERLQQEWDQNLKRAQKLVIRIEMLAGVDSPPEAAQARKAYQISLLSAALVNRETAPPPAEEVRQLREEWLLIGPLPKRQRSDLRTRLEKALEAFEA